MTGLVLTFMSVSACAQEKTTQEVTPTEIRAELEEAVKQNPTLKNKIEV